jgi:hypothetical protein
VASIANGGGPVLRKRTKLQAELRLQLENPFFNHLGLDYNK